MNEELRKTFAQYTIQYHNTKNSIFKEKGIDKFPFHGTLTDAAITYIAKDGVATFYYNQNEKLKILGKGYSIYDRSMYDLSHVCQMYSSNLIKVYSFSYGSPYELIKENPSDIDLSSEEAVPWMINQEYWEAISKKNQELNTLTGVTVGPIINIEDGTQKELTPTRLQIWSPVVDIEGYGKVRLHEWVSAEFWWLPEEQDLSPDKAKQTAEADVLALEIISAENGFYTADSTKEGSTRHASDILEEHCDELLTLLDEHGENEEKLHQWLNEPQHHLFLDTNAIEVKSKTRFGSRISDFVVKQADDKYKLIEIEPAEPTIFTKQSEFVSRFTHAATQVRDWIRYVKDNYSTVRNEQGLANIYEPKGVVIMGRARHIQGHEAQNRWKSIKNDSDLEYNTYDDLINNVKALAQMLRRV